MRMSLSISSNLCRMLVMAVLLATMLAGTIVNNAQFADAQPRWDQNACNNLFRSGHGYYGCGGLQNAWDTGNYGWTQYYW